VCDYSSEELDCIRIEDAGRLKGVHLLFSVWWALALRTDLAKRNGQVQRETTRCGCVKGLACLLSVMSNSTVELELPPSTHLCADMK